MVIKKLIWQKLKESGKKTQGFGKKTQGYEDLSGLVGLKKVYKNKPGLDTDSFKKAVSFFGLTLPSSAVYGISDQALMTKVSPWRSTGC